MVEVMCAFGREIDAGLCKALPITGSLDDITLAQSGPGYGRRIDRFPVVLAAELHRSLGAIV